MHTQSEFPKPKLEHLNCLPVDVGAFQMVGWLNGPLYTGTVSTVCKIFASFDLPAYYF